MPRIGLVLAGGGMTGIAFHAGALAALEDATGWDPREAELIIGTSAGSIAGTMLRLGVPTSDQMARIEGRETSAATQRLLKDLPPPDPRALVDFKAPSSLAPVDPAALARALRHRGARRRVALLAAGIPEGSIDTGPMRQGFASLFPTFPDGLWICAVRVSDGRLAVFGRDDIEVSVADAVAASSAIPGFFKPPMIEGHKFVDGGLRSMANADLARGLGLDLVIVSSPMTFQPIAPGPIGAALAGPLRARLRREIRSIRSDGTKVLVLEPGAALRRTMGVNPMDPSRRPRVAVATRASVAATLEAADTSLLRM